MFSKRKKKQYFKHRNITNQKKQFLKLKYLLVITVPM